MQVMCEYNKGRSHDPVGSDIHSASHRISAENTFVE